MNITTFISPAEPAREPPKVPFQQDEKAALHVTISHEPFMPWFLLEFNGQTEELDHQEALDWFQAHGAKSMDKVNDAINQAFNFHKATITIGASKTPPLRPDQLPAYLPKI